MSGDWVISFSKSTVTGDGSLLLQHRNQMTDGDVDATTVVTEERYDCRIFTSYILAFEH